MLTSWLRLKNPVPRYTVTWRYEGGSVMGPPLAFRGTFRRCNDLMARLLDGGRAVDIVGYRPDGREDTWLFPAARRAAFAYPSTLPTEPGRTRLAV